MDNKKYAVVEFSHKDTMFLSAAPIKWINGSSCSWPKKEKERKAIKEAFDPQADWAVIENIKILGEYSTYKEALYYEERISKAKTDEEISDFDDKRDVTLGKRKSRPKSKYRDPSISPPPHLEIHENIISEEDPDEIHNNSQIIIEEVPFQPSKPKSVDVKSVEDDTSNTDATTVMASGRHQSDRELEILTTLITINERLSVIESKLINIEKTLAMRVAIKHHSNSDIFKLFPINTLGELQDFESKLGDEENEGEVLEFLQYVGGACEKVCVTRTLQKVLSNHCAMFCSWTGKKGNFKIKDLKLTKIIKEAVRVTYPNIKDDLFEKTTMQWLQFAKVRHERAGQK